MVDIPIPTEFVMVRQAAAYGYHTDIVDHFFQHILHYYCLVGFVVAIVTAEQEILGLIPKSIKVLLGFSIRNFSVTFMESRLVPG